MRDNVLNAKTRLHEGLEHLRGRHCAGASGRTVCRDLAQLRDQTVLDLVNTALADLNATGADELSSEMALVAHGGSGRREVAPSSDVDLMILHTPAVADRMPPLADRLLRDVFDAGLMLGHSVRTIPQACRLAISDATICTSLIDARLLAGSTILFDRFQEQFARQVRQHVRKLLPEILRVRTEERIRYGETVFLLEPNVKRSRGALRDVQLLHWIGFTRYGPSRKAAVPIGLDGSPAPSGEHPPTIAALPAGFRYLAARGLLTDADLAALEAAREFLLWTRNELHFQSNRAQDVLSRAEQLRIAELRGYEPTAGMIPVEQFMRDYFRHTNAVSHAVDRISRQAQSRDSASQWATTLFGQQIEGGVRVGSGGLFADRQALAMLQRNLTEIMRLVGLGSTYNKPITPGTWEVIRREAARLPDTLPAAACARFVALLDRPARLASILHNLHDIGLLERFIPEYGHARGLLQFNQYHKYTVDEHCLRAVEFACDLAVDHGPLGRVYRTIAEKHVLHLALLLHDLGKGHLEDHCELGRHIAESAALRLGLKGHEAEQLRFLVARHDLMNHLAFRRDTSDERLVVRFSIQAGTPELLKMLYVHTAADLAAVGPGVLDGWKIEVLTELYHRAMQHLAGDSAVTTAGEQFTARRQAVSAALGVSADPWFAQRLDTLPEAYLLQTQPGQVAADLRALRATPAGSATAVGRYVPETRSVVYTVYTSEDVVPGIFHRLCGALTSHGLEIRAAQINTLADKLVLDRFWVVDPDYADEPPPHRIDAINRSLVGVLTDALAEASPTFRRMWGGNDAPPITARRARSRVQTDNTTSDRYTILDVFTHDRTGLLYAVTRVLFKLGLSVWHAKIGTHLDQVVDVFYVTDTDNRKITDPARLQEIHDRLVEVLVDS